MLVRSIKVLIFFLCASVQASETLKILYIGGLSGSRVSQASSKSLNSLRVAVTQQNSRGGLLGKRIEILEFDTKGLPQESVKAISYIKKTRPFAVVGMHSSNDGHLLIPELDRQKIPTIVASATRTDLLFNTSFIARTCFEDRVQAKALAQKMLELKKKNILVATDVGDSFTLNLSKYFRKEYEKRGGKILDEIFIKSGQIDFENAVNRLFLNPKAEAIFISASAIESAYFMLSMVNHAVSLDIVGCDGWENQDLSQILTSLNQSLNVILFGAHWNSQQKTKLLANFKNTYMDLFFEELSDFDADAILTYDSALVLFRAVQDAGTVEPNRLMRSIKNVRLTGLSGPIRVLKSGESEKTVYFFRLNGRQMVRVP